MGKARWTEEQKTRLRALISGGATLDSAAAAMGVSRCAISGQVARLGLKMARPPGIYATPRSKKAIHSAFAKSSVMPLGFVPGISQGEKHKVNYKAKENDPKPLAPNSEPVSLLNVKNSQCKFPLWPDAKDGGPDFLVCGAPAHRYCDFHTRVIGA